MTYWTRRRDAFLKEWDESQHPRHPAGSERGGEFAPANSDEHVSDIDDPVPAKPQTGLVDSDPDNPAAPLTDVNAQQERMMTRAQRKLAERRESLDATLAGLKTEAAKHPGSPGSALPGTKVGDVMTASGHRPLSAIAREIRRDWGPKVYFGAKPYLEALGELHDIKDRYYEDSAESVVAYFLGNATGWRGEKARSIKAELNKILKQRR